MKDDDKFLESVLVFVDRNGSIVSKQSTPMSCSLKMEYDTKDLKVTMSAYSHGMGNGSCNAVVTFGGKVVYKAAGSFTSSPYNVEVSKYESGAWERMMGL